MKKIVILLNLLIFSNVVNCSERNNSSELQKRVLVNGTCCSMLLTGILFPFKKRAVSYVAAVASAFVSQNIQNATNQPNQKFLGFGPFLNLKICYLDYINNSKKS